jgi:hypothetical protein
MHLELLKSIVTELKFNNLSLLKIDQDTSATPLPQ